ncbi:MAG: hypothetical protein Q4D02_02870 [Clostridia bacterium]|nr:hypothetical protein [Clostridia bacterium]
MTQKEIEELFQQNFSHRDLEQLLNPNHTISQMSQGDKIIINDELLDYLRDFFDEQYQGKKIPKVFDKVLIELRNNPSGLIRIFIEFPEDKENFVYLDVFLNWTFIVKFIFVNVEATDKDPVTGRYITFMAPVFRGPFIYGDLSNFVKNIFGYAYLFVAANKEEKSVYTEEVRKNNTQTQTKAKKPKKQGKKKNYSPLERERVYIPKTRRVYSITKITPRVEENIRNYILAEWPVKGYTYTRRKSKNSDELIEVSVPPRVSKRRHPNAGVKKDVQGKDFILTQPKD